MKVKFMCLLGLSMLLGTCIVFNGCSKKNGSDIDETTAPTIQPTDKLVKPTADSTPDKDKQQEELPFSDNGMESININYTQKEGGYVRHITITPEDGEIVCKYTSDYLSEELTVTLDQESFNGYCDIIEKCRDANWDSNKLESKDILDYDIDEVTECGLVIKAKSYAFSGTGKEYDLIAELVGNMNEGIGGLDWKPSSGKEVEMQDYDEIMVFYVDPTGEHNKKRYVNYVTNPNCYQINEGTRELSGTEVDMNGENIENWFSENGDIEFCYTSLTDYKFYRYEFFELVSKIDFEKMFSNDQIDIIKCDESDNYMEPIYAFLRVTGDGEKTVASLKADNSVIQKEEVEGIINWSRTLY